jgi:integrase
MLLVAAHAGLRAGEIVALKWADIDWARRKLYVRQSTYRRKDYSPKDGEERVIPMTDSLANALRKIKHLRGDYVFYRDFDGERVSYESLRSMMQNIEKRAGMRCTGALHILRHTFASHLVMKNVPLKTVQEWLGHATMDMTLRYAHLVPSASDESIKVLENGDKVGEKSGEISTAFVSG